MGYDLVMTIVCFFIILAEEKGYSRAIVLSFEDKYKHSPLHAAINSGNSEVIHSYIQSSLLLIFYLHLLFSLPYEERGRKKITNSV